MHAERAAQPALPPLPGWAKAVHVVIIANLAIQIGYALFQVFVVLRPEGQYGPMFTAALDLPYEDMMVRRMYAIEGWIAFVGLALYLAVTEIVPRRRS